MKSKLLYLLLLCVSISQAQSPEKNSIIVYANLDTIKNTILGYEEITYKNNSKDSLNEIILHAWPAAYRNRNTNLGKRRRENRKTDIHYAKEEQKGDIHSFLFKTESDTLEWSYKNSSKDIISIKLKKTLAPGQHTLIKTPFLLKLPDGEFTGFGYHENGYYLKDWYLSPAVYREGKWHSMSNKNMDDLFIEPTNYLIKLRLPRPYQISSNLFYSTSFSRDGRFIANISGKSYSGANIMIYKSHNFNKYEVETKKSNVITLETDLRYPFVFRMEESLDSVLIRQLNFLEDKLGPYKLAKLWVSTDYIKNNPIYTMNTIPGIETMNPKFQKDIEIFKSLSYNYINSSVFMNKRKNAWMIEGLNSYLLSEYINTYYPDKKLFGNLSDFWISRFFDLADLKFSDRQWILYMIMARQNLDQPIGIEADKMANLNLLAIKQFKASMGLEYLKDYLKDEEFDKSIMETFNSSFTSYTDDKKMQKIFAENSENKSDWFFNDYINKRELIDYKITRDKGNIVIKNKTNYSGPLKVYGYKNDSLIFTHWLEGFKGKIEYQPLRKDIDRIVLNDKYIIPEYNLRDNTLKYDKKWYHIVNRPLQLKLLRDIENPKYNQIFYNPNANWNAYDGLLLGGAFYNKSIIRKPLLYKISPYYAFKAQSLTGSANVTYTHYLREHKYVDAFVFGLFGTYSHYDRNLAYIKFNPAFRILFKRQNLRGVENNYIFMRYVSVEKEQPKGYINPDGDLGKYEEYKIFNLRYVYENPEIINDYRLRTDLQIGDKFGKLSTEFRLRKKTDWKNLIDFRIFAGYFLYNNVGNTYYDFGINSSTDYLFDYNFLGRSETTGILSQQIIVNDGAFKTKYNAFANKWLLSTNAHVSIWKFFEVYGDAGMYSNTGEENKFIWDAGIRLNFVPEILEFYFPIHSNMGSELTPNYESKIRFVFTANFDEIISYFRRGLF